MTLAARLLSGLGGTGQPPDARQDAWLGAAGEQLLGIFLGLLGFLAIAAALWLLLRFLQRRSSAGSARGGIEVLSRMPLTQTAFLMIIRVYGRCLLISVGKDSASLICEVEPEKAAAAEEASGSDADKGFWGRFVHNILYNAGLRSERAYPPVRGQQNAAPEARRQAEDRASAVMEEALARIAEAQGPPAGQAPQNIQTGLNTPISASKDVERSGQIGIDRKQQSTAQVDYNAAIERMRFNAQAYAPQRKPEPVTQSAPAAPAVSDASEEEKPDFARALQMAQQRGQEEETYRQDETGKQDELDALFEMIAGRRERMSRKRKREGQ